MSPLFFEHFLAFWLNKMFQDHLVLFLLLYLNQLRVLFSIKWYLETKLLIQSILIAIECHNSYTAWVERSRGTYVCVYVYILTSLYVFASLFLCVENGNFTSISLYSIQYHMDNSSLLFSFTSPIVRNLVFPPSIQP